MLPWDSTGCLEQDFVSLTRASPLPLYSLLWMGWAFHHIQKHERLAMGQPWLRHVQKCLRDLAALCPSLILRNIKLIKKWSLFVIPSCFQQGAEAFLCIIYSWYCTSHRYCTMKTAPHITIYGEPAAQRIVEWLGLETTTYFRKIENLSQDLINNGKYITPFRNLFQ